jgi:hypothetical protein
MITKIKMIENFTWLFKEKVTKLNIHIEVELFLNNIIEVKKPIKEFKVIRISLILKKND